LEFFAVCHTTLDSLNRGISSIHQKVNLLSSYSHIFNTPTRKIEFPANRNKLMIDSGAFDLLIRGENDDFPFTPKEYAEGIRKMNPKPDFVVSMDYICSPEEKNENLDLIHKTIKNAEILRKEFKKDKDIWFIPVVQGYYKEEYLYCIKEMVKRKIVQNGDYIGIGSLAARRKVKEPREIIKSVYDFLIKRNIRVKIHCFGLNLNIIKDERIFNILSSIDSLAWTYPYRFGRVKMFTRERMIEANTNGNLKEPEFYFLSLNATLKYLDFLNKKYRYYMRESCHSFNDIIKKKDKKRILLFYKKIAKKLGANDIQLKNVKTLKNIFNLIIDLNEKFPREAELNIDKIPAYTSSKFLLLEAKNVKIGRLEFLFLFLSALNHAYYDYFNDNEKSIEKFLNRVKNFYSNLNKNLVNIIEKTLSEINGNEDFLEILNIKGDSKNYINILEKLMKKIELKQYKIQNLSSQKQINLEGVPIKDSYYLLIDDFDL